jgi:hypothetical protein
MNSRLRTKSRNARCQLACQASSNQSNCEEAHTRCSARVERNNDERQRTAVSERTQSGREGRTRAGDARGPRAEATGGGTTHHGVRTGGALVGREADIVDDEASNREVCRRTNKVSLMAFAAKPSFLEGRVRAGQPSRLSDRRASGPLRGRAKHSQPRPCRATRSLLTRHGSEQGQRRKDDGGRGWDG